MALANVGWILASCGKRVLLIDWDLEAPGLHRYLHPFLDDQELAQSPGLIDYFVDFTRAASEARRTPPPGDERMTAPPWHAPFSSLLRYSSSLDWDFGEGTLDLVPAGQQGPGYAQRVNGFDWHGFFDKLGGGVLLERLKRTLRCEYDYVLIDSRTGISDTSGICTVQMPDQLVVCFTLNRQSVLGASAVAASADAQRRRATGEPALRVWPLVTRVEHAEKERLDAARAHARGVFQGYLGHLPRAVRADYWSDTEVLYQPYFAYEEVLAVFAERRRQRASMLSSLEGLTRHLSRGGVTALGSMPEEARERALQSFRRAAAVPAGAASAASDEQAGRIFIAYPKEDQGGAHQLALALMERLGHAHAPVIWYDREQLRPGDDLDRVLADALQASDIVLLCFGAGWTTRVRASVGHFEEQIAAAQRLRKKIVPILLEGLTEERWVDECDKRGLHELKRLFAASVFVGRFEENVVRLARDLERMLAFAAKSRAERAPVDPEDPHKGQWGGRSKSSTRALSATVEPISDDWFSVTLTLESAGGEPLTGPVEFHLHPTFEPAVQTIEATSGRASLQLAAWGAFTVGVRADGGSTSLELDLSEVQAPRRFLER